MSKYLLPIVFGCSAVLCLSGLGLYAYKYLHSSSQPVYLTGKVVRSTIESTVAAMGTLQAIRQVDVGSQISGQLKELKVHLGQHVDKGQLLAEIDPVLLENSLRSSQATLDSLAAQRLAAKANLWQAESAFKRQNEMLQNEATSRQEVEAANAQVQVNMATMQSFEAQMRQAKTQVDSAVANLAYTKIVAPMEGEVAAILTDEGQTVVAAQQAPVILKLANLDQMTVRAQISEADVMKIHIGDEAYFTMLGNTSVRYVGKLRAVEPAPQEFLNNAPKAAGPVFYNGLFDVANPGHALRIGMTANVAILLKQASNVLNIPVSALGARDSAGRYAVRMVQGNAGLRTVYVPVGISNNIRVEILGGVREGDEIVISESPGSGQ